MDGWTHADAGINQQLAASPQGKPAQDPRNPCQSRMEKRPDMMGSFALMYRFPLVGSFKRER